jgi:hypothetical protein
LQKRSNCVKCLRACGKTTALEAYRFLGEAKNAASLKQIRAALSFAYKHWDLKNPFACWIGMSESYVVLKAEK